MTALDGRRSRAEVAREPAEVFGRAVGGREDILQSRDNRLLFP